MHKQSLTSCTFLPQYDAQLIDADNTELVGLDLFMLYRFNPELIAFLMKL
jgi:hypothetical protein